MANADPFRHPERLVTVPWLMPYYWRSHKLVDPYVNARMLPGRMRLMDLYFPELYLRFFIPDRYFLRLSGDTPHHARVELMRLLQKRLRQVSGEYPVTVILQLDTFGYRTFGESLYG